MEKPPREAYAHEQAAARRDTVEAPAAPAEDEDEDDAPLDSLVTVRPRDDDDDDSGDEAQLPPDKGDSPQPAPTRHPPGPKLDRPPEMRSRVQVITTGQCGEVANLFDDGSVEIMLDSGGNYFCYYIHLCAVSPQPPRADAHSPATFRPVAPAAREDQLRRELVRAMESQLALADTHGTKDAFGKDDEALRQRLAARRRALDDKSLRAHSAPAQMLAQHRASAAERSEAQSSFDFITRSLAAACIDDNEAARLLAPTAQFYRGTQLSRAKIGATTEEECKQLARVEQEEADLPPSLKKQADAASAARLSEEEARLALARKDHAKLEEQRAEWLTSEPARRAAKEERNRLKKAQEEAEKKAKKAKPRGRAPLDSTGAPATWDSETGVWVGVAKKTKPDAVRPTYVTYPCPAGCGRTFNHPPAAAIHGKTCPGAIEGRASKLPAERGPGDGVGKGAVLRMFFEGFGWATGHVQYVTRDGAVEVFWVSDDSYSTITRSVAAAHVVLPALVSAPMHA